MHDANFASRNPHRRILPPPLHTFLLLILVIATAPIAKAQYRASIADFYNLFNKANLGTINATLGTVSPTGALVGSPNSNFGVANGALGARTIQMQARFSS